jgi:hypothetical protein
VKSGKRAAQKWDDYRHKPPLERNQLKFCTSDLELTDCAKKASYCKLRRENKMRSVKAFFSAVLLFSCGMPAIAQGGLDRDSDNDGVWDYRSGGLDRDLDNDGVWDAQAGGLDRDLDNDGVWDAQSGGLDRDLDNDGTWDAQSGGLDRDLDNDGVWDAQAGGLDRDLDNDGVWDN